MFPHRTKYVHATCIRCKEETAFAIVSPYCSFFQMTKCCPTGRQTRRLNYEQGDRILMLPSANKIRCINETIGVREAFLRKKRESWEFWVSALRGNVIKNNLYCTLKRAHRNIKRKKASHKNEKEMNKKCK